MINFFDSVSIFQNNKNILIIFGLSMALIFCIFIFTSSNQDFQRNIACKNLVSKDVTEDNLDSTYVVGSFYSQTLNTCVETRIAPDLTGEFSYLIRDVGHGFIKEDNLIFLQMHAQTNAGLDYSKTIENLFYCDSDGVDNTILSKITANDGIIWDLPYKDYLDDFHGGLPRSVQTPTSSYTDIECQNYFNLKLQQIK